MAEVSAKTYRLNHAVLKREMARLNLSQNAWARRFGLSKGHLSQLVNGTRPFPRSETRRRLLEGLGLAADELFEIRDDSKPDSSHAASPYRRKLNFKAGRLRLRMDWISESESDGGPWVNSISTDLWFGLRSLLRYPGYSLLVILVVGVSLGLATSSFGVMSAVLHNPLLYPDAEQLVLLSETRRNEEISVAFPNFLDWEQRNTSFSGIGAFQYWTYTLLTAGPPRQLRAYRVSGGFFSTLAVRPLVGREISAADSRPGAPPVVVLSHSLWSERFASDPEIIGESIDLSGRFYTIIGVMPRGFDFYRSADIWLPIGLFLDEPELHDRNAHAGTYAIARLKPELKLDRARRSMAQMAEALARDFPESNVAQGIALTPLADDLVGAYRTPLWLVFGSSLMVLLIGWVNLGHLVAIRTAARQQEIATRLALGAGRWMLVRQFLLEHSTLGLLGGLLGLVAAAGANQLVRELAPRSLPNLEHLAVDHRVVGFALLLSVAWSLIISAVPLLGIRASDSRECLQLLSSSSRTTSGRSSRFRLTVMIAEVGLSLLLMMGAALTGQSFLAMLDADPGFEPSGVLTFELSLPDSKYPDWGASRQFFSEFLGRLHALPGVENAGVVNPLPLSGRNRSQRIWIEGRPYSSREDLIRVDYAPVTPGYFATLGIPLLSGELFSGQEPEGPPPTEVVVDETFAIRFWPGEDPLGRRIKSGGPESELPWLTVRGVVGHVKQYGVQAPSRPQMYFSFRQLPFDTMTVALKTPLSPQDLLPAIRSTLAELDPKLPIDRVRTLSDSFEESTATPRFTALVLIAFAVAGLLLAVVGIYGVTSHAATLQQREIALRMALGAASSDIRSWVLRQGMTGIVVGICCGLAATLLLSRLLSGFLFEIAALDPATLAATTAATLLCGLLGTLIPAQRATQQDPASTLRQG